MVPTFLYSRFMRFVLRLLYLAFFLPSLICAQAQESQPVSWLPSSLANGSPCLFTVEAPGATAVTGEWFGHTLAFFHKPKGEWYALAGVDIEVAPGSYPLTIEVTSADGSKRTIQRRVAVAEAPYKQIPLTVPEKFVEPDATAQKQIAADKTLKDKVFASTAPRPLWSGRFSPPLHTAPSTDSFGTRRVFNGKLASVHRGLDYRAKTGTPVMAVNAGRVVLARPLYFEGGCVIIDHGQGLMTLYMHLSRFKVKEGELVKRGQVVAISGGTGRATGPHLHLGVRWDGAYLDAAKLFKLDLPVTP